MRSYSNEDLIDLNADLIAALPGYTHGSDHKDSKSHFIETEIALRNKFIRYGTKKTLNVLMFDIDDTKITSVAAYNDHIINTIGINPTFTLKTDRGFHFGLILEKMIFRTHYNNSGKTSDALIAAAIKKEITIKLNGDLAGSNRLIGIWRNPLMHDFIYSGNKFNLLDLASSFGVATTLSDPGKQSNINHSSFKLSSTSNIERFIKDGFVPGNRNNYIFGVGFKIVFENRSKVSTIEEELLQINRSHNKSLSDYEIINIAKSIIKIEPTMYQVNLEKKRGKLSNIMWDLNIHGVENRRSFAGFITSRDRAAATVERVTNKLLDLFDKGVVKPNNKTVSEVTELSVRQWQRVKKGVSAAKIFLMYVQSIGREIVIRASVIPILNKRWKGLFLPGAAADHAAVNYDYENMQQIKLEFTLNNV